ncbi:MAG: hypothetical protein PHT40_00545 [Patescibacteria group bacterium]|nr:hypothetical protein [Patescibacteria group bacterium]
MAKQINKPQTIQNILDRANRSNGISINTEKFNQKKDDENFLVEAANFVGAEVVFII